MVQVADDICYQLSSVVISVHSPVMTEHGMFVMYCMQCMSVPAVL